METSQEVTVKIVGGHLDSPGVNPGLKQLFDAADFGLLSQEQEEKDRYLEKMVQKDADGMEFVELTIPDIETLIKARPEKKLLFFNLLNQQMSTTLTKIQADTPTVEKIRLQIEEARSKSDDASRAFVDTWQPRLLKKERVLSQNIELRDKQIAAMKELAKLIQEDEALDDGSPTGKTFHAFLRGPARG